MRNSDDVFPWALFCFGVAMFTVGAVFSFWDGEQRYELQRLRIERGCPNNQQEGR